MEPTRSSRITSEDALIETGYYGRLESMKVLLAAGARITGKNAPHHACKLRDDVRFVERLLKAGADINKRDSLGRTPLSLASIPNHYRTVKYLLEYGADIEAKDAFGHSPLHRAVNFGSLESARLYIEAGPEVTHVDEGGCSILHRTALSCDLGMFKLLSEVDLSCLDTGAQDITHSTPLQLLIGCKPSAEVLTTSAALLQNMKRNSEVDAAGDSDSDDDIGYSSLQFNVCQYEDALEFWVDEATKRDNSEHISRSRKVNLSSSLPNSQYASPRRVFMPSVCRTFNYLKARPSRLIHYIDA